MEDILEAAVTPEEIDAAVTDAYAKAGLAKVNRAGDTVPDTDAMKERAYQVVSKKVVNDRAEMATNSVTGGELYAAVFPGAPGTSPNQALSDLSLLEEAVRTKLRRAVWSLTNPNRKGAIQTRLGKEGRTQVLVRTKVQRGVDEIQGVFVTDDPDLIVHESVHPVVEKLLGAARELRLHNEVVVEGRHPELAPQVTKLLNVARKRVMAELARPNNGDTPALERGNPREAAEAE